MAVLNVPITQAECTRAELDTALAANKVTRGRLYYITDEDVLVVGNGPNTKTELGLSLYLPGAVAGGTVGISAVDARGWATLVALPPVPAQYEVSASNAQDVPIPSDGAWYSVVSGTGGDFPTTQTLPPDSILHFAMRLNNSTGLTGGTIHIGLEGEDTIGNPGVLIPPDIWIVAAVPSGTNALYTKIMLLENEIPAGYNLSLMVRADIDPAGTELGSWGFLGGALTGGTLPGEFRTNNAKVGSVTVFLINKTDRNGDDKTSWLMDLEIGSVFTMAAGTQTGTYVVDSVLDEGDAVRIDVSLPEGADINIGVGAIAVLKGTLTSGPMDLVAEGSVYTQSFWLEAH